MKDAKRLHEEVQCSNFPVDKNRSGPGQWSVRPDASKEPALKSIVSPLVAALVLAVSLPAAAQHLDVKLGTSNGPVAGSKIDIEVYGDLNWYIAQTGGSPVEHGTGTLIVPANFNDAPGGPFATDNPGFQSFAGQFLPNEELRFRAHDRLRYLPSGGTEWVDAAPGGGIRLMGSIPEDIVFDYVYNGTREAEYLYYEGGTLFAGNGVIGPQEAPIAGASSRGAFHLHLDWYLEGSARAAKGTYLVEMSLFSTAVSGGVPKYLESDRFHVIFRNDVTNDQFGAAMRTLTDAPAAAVVSGVPEPETWALAAVGLAIVGVATRRRHRPRR
jgi:hypothetical protein